MSKVRMSFFCSLRGKTSKLKYFNTLSCLTTESNEYFQINFAIGILTGYLSQI